MTLPPLTECALMADPWLCPQGRHAAVQLYRQLTTPGPKVLVQDREDLIRLVEELHGRGRSGPGIDPVPG